MQGSTRRRPLTICAFAVCVFITAAFGGRMLIGEIVTIPCDGCIADTLFFFEPSANATHVVDATTETDGWCFCSYDTDGNFVVEPCHEELGCTASLTITTTPAAGAVAGLRATRTAFLGAAFFAGEAFFLAPAAFFRAAFLGAAFLGAAAFFLEAFRAAFLGAAFFFAAVFFRAAFLRIRPDRWRRPRRLDLHEGT